MIDAREIGMRVLVELEEAGAENVSSTMNTVWPPAGNPDELTIFKEALKSLVGDGLVTFGYAPSEGGRLKLVSQEVALETVDAISELVSFRGGDKFWVWDRTHPRAEIVATPAGLNEARKILDERGYQWWRQHQDAPE